MFHFKEKVGFLLIFFIVSSLAIENKKEESTDFHDHPHDKEHHNVHTHQHEPEHRHDEEIKVPEDQKIQKPVDKVPPKKVSPASTIDEASKSEVSNIDAKLKNAVSKSEIPSEAVHKASVSSDDATVGRQFHPMYQPMFQQPTGFNMIRRQFGGGMDILGDIVMMGMIGLPILGLLTMGSSSIANFLGFGSSGSKSSSKRSKRSLKEKAAGAVEYAKNLWEVMEQLERAFEKYDLYQNECRLRAVCEAHQKVPKLGAWGKTMVDLMSKQKELESREILPVSRFLFSSYVEAAQFGSRGGDCVEQYTGCPHHLSYYISAKEDFVENEVS